MVKLCFQVEEKILSDNSSDELWQPNSLLRGKSMNSTFKRAPWDSIGSDSDQRQSFHELSKVVLAGPEVNQQVEVDEADIFLAPSGQTESNSAILLQDAAAANKIELEQQKRSSFEEGFERGVDHAKEGFEAVQTQFLGLIDKINAAQSDMTTFYNPLKKLAIHIAEQLVRGELTLSSVAIERLIGEAVTDLGNQGSDRITVSLNDKDRMLLSSNFTEEFPQIDFRSDDLISQGSVALSFGDTGIEDFLEHRLHALAEEIFQPQDPEKHKRDITKTSELEKSDSDLPSQSGDVDTLKNDNTDSADVNQTDV